MLLAYADESGHAADPKVDHIGIVGLVAPETSWDQFRPRWSAALQNEGVQHFHMRQFAHSIGPFVGWPETRRQSLLNALLDAIDDLNPELFGSVISLAAWRQLVPEARRLFQDPFFACIQELAWFGSVHAATVGQDRITFILSDAAEFNGKGQLLFDALKTSGSMPPVVDGYLFRPMKDDVALEAADLAAYEVVLAHDRVAKGQTQLRYPLRRLQKRKSFVRYVDAAYLEQQVLGAITPPGSEPEAG